MPEKSHPSTGEIKAELTERIRVLEKKAADLTESGKLYKTLFESANDQIVYLNEKGRVIDSNIATQTIFGYSPDEVIGEYFWELPIFNQEFQEKILAEIDPEKPFGDIDVRRLEFEGIDKNQKRIFVEVSTRLVYENQKTTGMVCILRDVTQQALAEQKLMESEEMARAMLHATSDAVLLVDQEGSILDLNPAFAQLFNRSTMSCIGLGLSTIIQDRFPLDLKTITKAVKKGKLNRSEFKYKGSWFIQTIYPVCDVTGNFTRAGVFIRDVSSLKKAETILKRHRDELGVEVKKRTRDLEESNTALKVLLKKRDEDKQELEERFLSNAKELVIPFIEELSDTQLSGRQQNVVSILKYNLEDMISPFIKQLSSRYLSLTPTELHIANIIKQGKTSKEIAEALKMEPRNVDNHRYNIRKKLGINNKKASLATYLLSLK